MIHSKKLSMVVPALLLVLFVAACAPAAAPLETGNDQAAIDAAVQATLTAVAQSQSVNSPAAGTPVPDAPDSSSTPAPAPAVAPIILPPEVPNFDSPINPAKTLGDANAPIVMYEWSDYT